MCEQDINLVQARAEIARLKSVIEGTGRATEGGYWAYGFVNATTDEFVCQHSEGEAHALAGVFGRPVHRRWIQYGPVELVAQSV